MQKIADWLEKLGMSERVEGFAWKYGSREMRRVGTTREYHCEGEWSKRTREKSYLQTTPITHLGLFNICELLGTRRGLRTRTAIRSKKPS